MEDATVRDYAETFGTKLYYGDYDQTKDYATQTDPATLIAGIDDFANAGGKTVEKYGFVRQDQETKDETVIPKAIRLSELQFTLGFNKDRAEAIDALVGVMKFWKVLLADGSKIVFPGYISEFSHNLPKGQEVLHPVKIQPHKKQQFVKAAAA